jgi:hypothetical protein
MEWVGNGTRAPGRGRVGLEAVRVLEATHGSLQDGGTPDAMDRSSLDGLPG